MAFISGWFNDRWFPRDWWQEDEQYWQETPAPTPGGDPITQGWWQQTWWPRSWWQINQQYWQKVGAVPVLDPSWGRRRRRLYIYRSKRAVR